ncbi:unnamed protein product [Mytilus coruscus]|uniref:Uncharacterized protein n=1 Tax=Mytilus coruscus TaxID=42192 RepID=A0A6J8A4V1_MYTCO|nr:unnamed protein product [Mytilus coruscus]
MRDEEFNDWKKLISVEHINMASKYIRRLSIALKVAFVTKFLQSLKVEEQNAMKDDLKNENANCMKWNDQFENFLEYGKSQNATFMLHTEMLNHSEEISALSFAERLGGSEGYSLMLAAVKMSLPFAFLNGSTSYAAYAVNLLHEHYKSGKFYQNVKAALFTTTHQKVRTILVWTPREN